MPDASFVQTSFLAGEWSPYAQGRMDLPQYRQAMAVCLNAIPVEEGAAPRRPGTAFAGTTLNGATGRTINFTFDDKAPHSIELTSGTLRMRTGLGLVFTDDIQGLIGISTQNPALISLAGAVTWNTGDQIQFLFNSVVAESDCNLLRNRQFTITMSGTSAFTITDPITGDTIDGSTLQYNPEDVIQVAHILMLATPYAAADLPLVTYVQAAEVGANNSDVLLLLHADYYPQSVQALDTGLAANTTNVTIVAQAFADGPYLDAIPGLQVSPNALSGSITLTGSYAAWNSSTGYSFGDVVSSGSYVYQCIVAASLNNEPPSNNWALVTTPLFQSTDVGRSVRLFSEPAAWEIGTSYSVGDNVGYNGAYYQCIVANEGDEPDTNLTSWLVTDSQSVYTWTWGVITTYISATEVTITLLGAPLLYEAVINTWQLGVYSETTGYPSCGCFYEGRLWLAGSQPNRVDSSNSDDFYNFAPTAADGTVGDANSISAIFNADDDCQIYWMKPTSAGIVCGTRNGEWLLQASSLQDPLTPTSIQAHRQTKVGCAQVPPISTPLTIVFVQKLGRMVFEYFQDVFSQRLAAPNLNTYSKHLTTSNVLEMAYQAELTPVVWARTGIGQLIGWTYRRVSMFSTEEPKFVAAHQHQLGSGRTVISLTVTPSPDNTLETPQIVTTNGGEAPVCHVELLTPLLDPNAALTSAWFVDDAVTPSGAVTTPTGVTFYGLWHLNGSTVSAVVGGLDCGDHLVSNGSMFVPYQSDPGQLLTLAYLQTLSESGDDFGAFATFLDTVETGTQAGGSNQVIRELPLTNAAGGTPVGGFALVHWPTEIGYFFVDGDGYDGTGGVTSVNLENGQIIAAKTAAQILGTDSNTDTNIATAFPQLCIGQDGNLYWYCSDTNFGKVCKVNGTTLALDTVFGVNDVFDNWPLGVPQVASMVPIFVGGVQYLVMYSVQTQSITVLNATAMTAVGTEFDVPNTVLDGSYVVYGCGGVQNAAGGAAYFLYGGSPAGNVSSLYLLTAAVINGVVTCSVCPAILPSSIDPSWTLFSGQAGPIFDGTDGTVICLLQSPNSVPYETYVVKFRPADGSIVWKIPLATARGPASYLFNGQSNVANGVLTIFSTDTGPALVIDTATGKTASVTVKGVSNGSAFISDANSGSLLMNATLSNTSGAPTPAPGTPTSFTNKWCVLTAGGQFQSVTSDVTTRLTIPAVIGFTYTTQGQILRPAVPQDAGTANGPGFGKTHRQHMFGLLLAGAIYGAISVGTLFTKLRPCNFKTEAGAPYATNTLFSGLHWNTLEDNYSFDSQLCWQVTRPLPGNVVSIGGFINTQDR